MPPGTPPMAGRTKGPAALWTKVLGWWNQPDRPMEAQTLIAHLNALRRTLMVIVLAVLLAFAVLFLTLSKQMVNWVTEPLKVQHIQVIFTDVSEAFNAQTKLSFIAAVVVASPVIFAAIWLFIRPALRRKERIIAGGTLALALGLFALGVYFAYRYVFFLAVNFFVYAGDGVAEPMLSVGTYVSFLFGFLLPFGIMFELPIVAVLLTRWGLVTTRTLNRARKYIILGIFVVAAVLTPPDVVSQVMLGVPLWALFEVGVLLSWLLRPREKADTCITVTG